MADESAPYDFDGIQDRDVIASLFRTLMAPERHPMILELSETVQ